MYADVFPIVDYEINFAVNIAQKKNIGIVVYA